MQLLAKLPGLGPRSARRVALQLLKKRETLLEAARQRHAGRGGGDPRSARSAAISIRRAPAPSAATSAAIPHVLCIVEDVADLWALERAGVFRGRYHVLGGALSALDGVTPERLNITPLMARLGHGVDEVILAMNATVEGQTTAHYLMDVLASQNVKVTRLAHGVPVGGELDYLDEGTLSAAFKARRAM